MPGLLTWLFLPSVMDIEGLSPNQTVPGQQGKLLAHGWRSRRDEGMCLG